MASDELEPAGSIPNDVLCAICYHVVNSHRACPQCRQSFCSTCIESWMRQQRRKATPCSCPYCRAPLRFSSLIHDSAFDARVGALLVHCPNRTLGCTQTLPRAGVASHLASECPYAPAPCPDCGVSMPRHQLQLHTGSPACPSRRMPCPNSASGCPAQLPPDALTRHVTHSCPAQPLTCTACGTHVPRRAALEHAHTACPARVHCPHRAYGCGHVSPDTQHLLSQHLGNGTCRYAPGTAIRSRLQAALGVAEEPAANHPYNLYDADGRYSAYGMPCGANGGGGADLCAALGMGASRPHAAAPAPATGQWVYGMWVPAELYPGGLPQPQPGANEQQRKQQQQQQPGRRPEAWSWVVESTADALQEGQEAGAGPLPAGFLLELRHGQQQQVEGDDHKAGAACGPQGGMGSDTDAALARQLEGVHLDMDPDRGSSGEAPPARGTPPGGSPAAATSPSPSAPTLPLTWDAVCRGSPRITAYHPHLLQRVVQALSASRFPSPAALQEQAAAALAAANVASPASTSNSTANAAGGVTGAEGRRSGGGGGAGAVAAGRAPGGVDWARELLRCATAVISDMEAATRRCGDGGGGDAGGSADGQGVDEELKRAVTCAVTAVPPPPPSAPGGGGRLSGGAAEGPGGGMEGVTAPDPLGQLDRATVYLALMAAAEAGEAPYGDVRQPPAGSWEADVLAAHRGSVVDVPAIDGSLHHGCRAFWALGLLRLAKRTFEAPPPPTAPAAGVGSAGPPAPSPPRPVAAAAESPGPGPLGPVAAPRPRLRLGWRCLAVLNDLVTGVARRLMGRVVEVLAADLVQDTAPMGEGDVVLAVQALFPPVLFPGALAAVRQAMLSYDDATCEASVWGESWSGLGSRLELCADLGHVACLVGQYTPMHGEYADDSHQGDSDEDDEDEEEEEYSEDDEDEDEAAEDMDEDDGDDVDMEGGSEGNGRGRRGGGGSGGGAGGGGGISGLLGGLLRLVPAGMRAPALEARVAAEVQQRAEGQAGQGAQGQEQEVDGEEGGGSGSDSGGGSSSSESSSDWESADEEEAAELIRQQQEQQVQQEEQAQAQAPGSDAAARQQGAAAPRTRPARGTYSRRSHPQPPDTPSTSLSSSSSSSTETLEYASSAPSSSPLPPPLSYGGSSSSSGGGGGDAYVRGVVALAAVLEWFAGSLLGRMRALVEAGQMRGGLLQPWHLQLALATSPTTQLLPPTPSPAPRPVLGPALVPPATAAPYPPLPAPACVAGGLPLGPLARTLASLALHPTSALLLLASTATATATATAVTASVAAPAAATAAPALAGAAATAATTTSAAAPGPATLSGGAADGPGAAGTLGSEAQEVQQAPAAVLCPLDLRYYCGREGGAAGAGGGRALALRGPRCSYWTGWQCAGCRRMTEAAQSAETLDSLLGRAAATLRAVHAAAAQAAWGDGGSGGGDGGGRISGGGHEGQHGEQQQGAEAGLALALPSDLVAAVTGGAVRGELLGGLLPPPLRPLLGTAAAAHAAARGGGGGGPGLAAALLRIRHLELSSWWAPPSGDVLHSKNVTGQGGGSGSDGGTGDMRNAGSIREPEQVQEAGEVQGRSGEEAMEGPGGDGAGGVARGPAGLQGEGKAGAAAAVVDVAALTRPHPGWLRALQPHLLAIKDVEAAAALGRDCCATMCYSSAAAAAATVQHGAGGEASGAGVGSSMRDGAGSGSGASGGEAAEVPARKGDAGTGAEGRGDGGGQQRPWRWWEAVDNQPPPAPAIPREEFEAAFEEARERVREERRAALAAAEAAAAAAGPGGFGMDAGRRGQQPGTGGEHVRQREEVRQAVLSMPPAMGVVEGPAVRYGSSAVLLGLVTGDGGERGDSRAPGASPSGRGVGARDGTRAAPEDGGGPADGSVEVEAEAENEAEDGVVWSRDALEVLHAAAEQHLLELLAAAGSVQ